MCGISVILLKDGVDLPGEAIDRMADSLAHRGPDERACVVRPGCHLGHTRLSIIDLAGGHQPMTEETGRYWIVFNGEIFNYRELRSELQGCGWTFRTQSDTEVLLRAYQQFGEDAPSRLNGQFAFAIWDEQERTLFAARDRFGEKPLYLAETPDGHLLLASEIKALLASALFTPVLDRVSLGAYLALLYVPPHRTIYANVRTLPPGSAMTVKGGQARQWRYWQPCFVPDRQIEMGEAVERTRALISQAVKRQMIADVPVGAFLSGGLDSSTIVALMTEHSPYPVKTFSAGFGDLINELPYAREVAGLYHTEHHEMQMDIPVGEMLERMADIYDEPLADSSNIPTYLIAGLARQNVTVALSGDGGDEIFGGYDWYIRLFPLADRGRYAGAAAVWNAAAWALRVCVKAGLPLHGLRDGAHTRAAALRARTAEWWDAHVDFITRMHADPARPGGALLAPALADLRAAYAPERSAGAFDRTVDFDANCYLPGDILVKVDRAAMAHSLETRAPFLDVDLVEFVYSLPWTLRLTDEKLKYLLHASCGDLWPASLRGRGKQGFGAPVPRWVERPDVRALLQRVLAPAHPMAEIVPGAAGVDWSPQQQWTLLCLGLWLERRTACLRPA